MRASIAAATFAMLTACGAAPPSAEVAAPITTAPAQMLALAAAPDYLAKETDLGNQGAMSCADPVTLEQLRAELKWRGGGFSDAEVTAGTPEWKQWEDRANRASCLDLRLAGGDPPHFVDYFERVRWAESPDDGKTWLQGQQRRR